MTTKTENVYQKLTQARKKIVDLKLKKTGVNPQFKGKNYYDMGDFLPQVNSVFCDLGLVSVFQMGEVASLEVINADNFEERIMFTIPVADARGQSPIQALGSQLTYLKRYLYFNALELAEDDTVDADGAEQNEVQKTKKQNNQKPKDVPTKEQITAIKNILPEERISKMLEYFKIDKLEDMSGSELQVVIEKELSKLNVETQEEPKQQSINDL